MNQSNMNALSSLFSGNVTGMPWPNYNQQPTIIWAGSGGPKESESPKKDSNDEIVKVLKEQVAHEQKRAGEYEKKYASAQVQLTEMQQKNMLLQQELDGLKVAYCLFNRPPKLLHPLPQLLLLMVESQFQSVSYH